MDQNVILTGVTGILGSHILYELLFAKLISKTFDGKLILICRSGANTSARDRVLKTLDHQFAPEYLHQFDPEQLMSHITVIDADLRDTSGLADQIRNYVHTGIIIHCGSSVNLGTDSQVEEEIIYNNYEASVSLLKETIEVADKFVYISTAFASGHRDGEIDDDFLNYNHKVFRNHYEKYKSMAEQEIVDICEKHGIQWQILRPSIICGRLIDIPKYFIPKYLVFYLVGDFFMKMQRRYASQPRVRMLVPPEASLNIVPVDYSAKAIVKALHLQESTQLNVVSERNVRLTEIIDYMLGKVGYTHYEFVEEIPEQQNEIEKFYYKWIGSQLNHYINTPAHHYSTTQLRTVLEDVQDPNVTDHFDKVFDYAYSHKFKNHNF